MRRPEEMDARPDQLLGHPLEMLLPERLRARHVLHRQHYFVTPSARPMGTQLELLGRRQNGSEFPVDISLRPLVLDGQIIALAAVRDMSQQRRDLTRRHALEQQAQLTHGETLARLGFLQEVLDSLPSSLYLSTATMRACCSPTGAPKTCGEPIGHPSKPCRTSW